MTSKQVRFVKADALNDTQHVAELAVFDADGTPLDPPTAGGGDATIADNAVTTAKIADGAVTTAKLASKAVTKEKIADGVIPTVPGKASTSADGLMSKEDKAKLDGVASGANAYVLPAATASTLGGVKQAAHVDGASGTVQQIVDSLVAAGIMASA